MDSLSVCQILLSAYANLGKCHWFSGALVWIHITVPVRKNHAFYTSLATVESQYYICIFGSFECTDCLSKAKLCSSFSKKKLSKIQKEKICVAGGVLLL